jgi:glutamate racemase
MDNRFVLFLDSGAGGLPYYHHFQLRNPRESLLYVADREYFPYGPRERGDLVAHLTALVQRLLAQGNLKLAALVCNTASVSALGSLREAFPSLPFVGTVPAIKPAVTGSRKRHIGVLGTEGTIKDPCIGELTARYGPDCRITGIAAPELVEFTERRLAAAGPGERRRMVIPYIETLRGQGADALVLGCTHFLLLLEEFIAAAAPDIRVYDSIEGVSRRIETLLDQGDLRSGGAPPERLLLLTGAAPPEETVIRRAAQYGLSLRLFPELP